MYMYNILHQKIHKGNSLGMYTVKLNSTNSEKLWAQCHDYQGETTLNSVNAC